MKEKDFSKTPSSAILSTPIRVRPYIHKENDNNSPNELLPQTHTVILNLFQDLSTAQHPLEFVKEHEEIPEQVRNDEKGVLGKFVIRSRLHVETKRNKDIERSRVEGCCPQPNAHSSTPPNNIINVQYSDDGGLRVTPSVKC